MQVIGSQRRETLEESGCVVKKRINKNLVILLDKETGITELWITSDDSAGYVIEIDGIGYEFVRCDAKESKS
jgi:hypothetical protein